MDFSLIAQNQIQPSEQSLSQKDDFIVKSEEDDKNRCSDITYDSELNRLSDLFLDDLQSQESSVLAMSLINQKILSKTTQTSTLSPLIIKRAVNWLITFCWTSDLPQQILWNSIGYFYAFISSRVLNKEKLTILLLSMVNLSLKLLEPSKILKIPALEHILITASDQKLFIEMEQELLEVLQFDVYFHNNYWKILSDEAYSEKTEEILFLCEVLFLSSYQVAINEKYLEDLVMLIDQPSSESKVKTELQRLAKGGKHIQNMKLKYSSKFDVDKFWGEFIG